jgi:hypothetical protein
MRFPTPSEEKETWPLDCEHLAELVTTGSATFLSIVRRLTVFATRDGCQVPTSDGQRHGSAASCDGLTLSVYLTARISN